MRKWPLLACLILLISGVAQAQETATGDYSEIEKLIRSFRDATASGDLVTAADPDVVSPFGGPSQLPPETTAPVTVTGTFTGLFNSGPMPVPTPDGVEFGGFLRPRPGDEITSLYDLDTLLQGAFGLGQMPPLATDGMTRQDIIDSISGTPYVIVGDGDPFGGPVVFHGGVVAQPIPLDCPGQILEYGRVDLIEGQPEWQGFAENDLFNGGSQAIVTRCLEGQWQVERLVNQGPQFTAMPTDTVTLIFAQGWYSFTPLEEMEDSLGSRYFGFVTQADNPFQPDTTGSTAVPFPGLAPIEPDVLLTDPNHYLPGPPVSNHPLILDFTNGSCPPQSWADVWEINLIDGSTGPEMYMEQLSTGQVVSGTPTVDPDGTHAYTLEGIGAGYTEHYQWSEPLGTYTLSNGTECTWDVEMDPEVWGSINDDVTALVGGGVTTTTPAPSTTSAGDTTTSVPSTSEEEPSSTGSPIWPWVLFALGLVGLALGGFFLLGARDPCDDLRKAWEAAERRLTSARKGLDQAADYLEERKARVIAMEASVAAFEKAAESSVTEHGVTYHLIEGGKVTSEGLESLTEGARRDLADAKAAETDAHKSVEEWKARVEEATRAAKEAREAYEKCIGEQTAPKAQPESAPVSSGPAVTAAPQAPPAQECNPNGSRKVETAGEATKPIDLTVDFSVFVEVIEGSERQVEVGKTLSLDLSSLAGELGTLGSLLGAYGAGRSVGRGVLGFQTGKYTQGAGKLVRGGAEGYIAGADPNIGTEAFPVSIPTSPQEVVTEALEATARLGSLVAGKVSAWMEMNQLYRVRMTYFYQSLSAAPYQVWVCRKGRWVCEERIFEVTVGKLQRRPGPEHGPFRLESDIARHRIESEVQAMVRAGRSALEQSVRRRAEFAREHQPGPCR